MGITHQVFSKCIKIDSYKYAKKWTIVTDNILHDQHFYFCKSEEIINKLLYSRLIGIYTWKIRWIK